MDLQQMTSLRAKFDSSTLLDKALLENSHQTFLDLDAGFLIV